MITKPDLLFRKEIEEIPEKVKLELTVLREIEKHEDKLRRLGLGENYMHTFDVECRDAFSPDVATFTSPKFAKDLGLLDILNDFLSPQYTPNSVYNALVHALVDIPTIHYRWEIIDELIGDRKKLDYLGQIGTQLAEVVKALHDREKKLAELDFSFFTAVPEAIQADIKVLVYYVETIFAFEKVLSGSSSEGLSKAHNYFIKVCESDRFKTLVEFVKKFISEQYVEIGVTLNGVRDVKKASYLGIGTHQLDRKTMHRLANEVFRRGGMEATLNSTKKGYFPTYFVSHEKWLLMAMEVLIKDSLDQIKATTSILGDLDFYNGAINFYDTLTKAGIPTTRPTILELESRTHRITDMFNPLIGYSTSDCKSSKAIRNKEKIIPNSLYASPDNNMFIVTGPNNAGKTRYSTGIGLIYVLAQSGFHIPARDAEISLVDNIFAHFVSGDYTQNKSGRWVNEIERANQVLGKITPYSLSLIDDFGSGTDYLEAREPALDVIYGHYRVGPLFIMNSHLHQLAVDIEKGQFPTASNWQVEVNETDEGVLYTFKIIPGRAGRSLAKQTAEEHGLSKDSIDKSIVARIEAGELSANLVKAVFEIQYNS